MQDRQPLRLGSLVKNVGNVAVGQMIVHSLGLAAANIFSLSAAAAIESWGGFLAITLTGAIALYAPLMGILYLMNHLAINIPILTDIIELAYVIACPVVGAVILNWMLGWTIPLAAAFVCAAVGGGVHLLFSALRGNNNTQETRANPPGGSDGSTSRTNRETRSTQGVVYVTATPMTMFMGQDPFAASDPSTIPRDQVYTDASRVEEVDENGHVIGAIPRTNTIL